MLIEPYQAQARSHTHESENTAHAYQHSGHHPGTRDIYSLQTISWNIVGLKKHVNNEELKMYLSQFDVVHLSETWSIEKSEFKNLLHDYLYFDIVRAKINRAFRSSGGISVFIKGDAFREIFRCRIHEEFSESIAFLLKDNIYEIFHRHLIMVFVYISPEGSVIYDPDEPNGIENLCNHL